MEKELADYVGFIIPNNNITIKENPSETHWTYKAQAIQAPQNAMDVYKDNMAVVDFSISHEFAHMLQDFVINMDINKQNLTKENYQNALNKFFKTDNIKVSDEMFAKFNDFFQKSPFSDKDLMHAIKFDDRFYVSAITVNNWMSFPNYDLYFGNLTEVHANAFASEFVMQKYEKEKQSPEVMKQLKGKIEEHAKAIPQGDRNESFCSIQIKIREAIDNDALSRAPFWKKGKIKNQLAEQNKRDLVSGVIDLNNYNFDKSNQYKQDCLSNMKAIQANIDKNHKTAEELKEYNEDIEKGMKIIQQVMKTYPNKITFIDAFAPHENDDPHTFYRTNALQGKLENLAMLIKNNAKIPVEIVVDIENKCAYFYGEPRTQEMKEADNLLENDNASMPESNDTLTINNDTREDR
jgi:hypothetical protein